jgi:hypothetical protein
MTPGVEVVLADGKTYTFPPLALASLEALQKRIAAFQGNADPESIQTVVTTALHSLRRNYPELSRKDLLGQFHEDADGDIVWDRAALLDLGNMNEVMQAVMDISGVKRKGQEAGKAAASQLNGPTSIAT